MDCSLPASSIHGIFQARILECVAIFVSRGSAQPRDRTWVSHISGRRFTIWATREAPGKNKQKNYTKKKKDLHGPDNRDGMITHLEPDIFECEVKWALGSIIMNKASGGDGIPVELFKILKDDAVKVLYSIWQQTWKSWQWPQDWKRSVFILIPKKGNA